MPPIRQAIVTSVSTLTPTMRRVTLGGPALDAFVVPPGALGPYLKLHVPDSTGRLVRRTYSVRAHDAARSELAIDMLVHAPCGVGSDFAARCRPGDAVGLSGPGHIPAEPCGVYLLAGDQTALPAIHHILDNLRDGADVRVLVEVPDRTEEQPRSDRPITWLHRRAGSPSRLAEAVSDSWPADGSDLLIWGGAEAMIARALRSHARAVRGTPPARCQILNYWKDADHEGEFGYLD